MSQRVLAYCNRMVPAVLLLGFLAQLGADQAVAAETSATNERLRAALARYPEADANGDGVLTMAEAQAYRARQSAKRGAGWTDPQIDLTKLQKSGKGLWVASTGHSLVAPALGPFATAAKAAGYDGHLQVRQLSGGASGSPGALWEQPEEKQTVKRALASGKCDVLTMGAHTEGSTVEDFARWIDLGLKHNPEMVVYIQDAWPYLTELLDPQAGKAAGKAADKDATFDRYQKKMAEINAWIGKGVEELNRKYPGKIHVIPIGNAMVEMVRRQLAGSLPGVDAIFVPQKKGEESSDGRVGLYRDAIHPGEPVAALEGYLYFACLYKKNPADLPKGLYPNAELDRILREVAWKTVTEHPHSGLKPGP